MEPVSGRRRRDRKKTLSVLHRIHSNVTGRLISAEEHARRFINGDACDLATLHFFCSSLITYERGRSAGRSARCSPHTK